MTTYTKAPEIAALNDLFRTRIGARVPGLFLQTAGIAALPMETQFRIREKVANLQRLHR